MHILAIETSCDETAISIIDIQNINNRDELSRSARGERSRTNSVEVLSNTISSQVNLHAQFGGVVPHLAAREHEKNLPLVLDQALTDAKISDIKNQIEFVAVTVGPGLAPALARGVRFAKELAQKYAKPLAPINHMEGHIYSNWLGPVGQPKPLLEKSDILPALCLLVSGGHTELVLMTDYGHYEILGETLDDAVGEAFDKVARLLGLGFPGGPAIARLASLGDPEAFKLPLPMARSKNLQFSYSGLKTAVLYLTQKLGPEPQSLDDKIKADIVASFQEVALNHLIVKTRLALETHSVKSLMVSGGVSASQLLRSKLTELAREFNIPYYQPDLAYTGDNGAMIAMSAYFHWLNKDHFPIPPIDLIDIDVNLRLESRG